MNCEHCGRFIEEKEINVCGHTIRAVAECACKKERRENQKHKNRALYTPMIREKYRLKSGIMARQSAQRFDSFSMKPGQGEAYRAAWEFATTFWDVRPTTGILFIGAVGSGKTHLAAAIANHVIDTVEISERDIESECSGFYTMTESDSGIRFYSSVSMFAKIRETFDSGEDTQDLINRICRSKLLILDDLGTEKLSEWVSERLFEIIDFRYNELLPTIITTNLIPAALKEKIGDRIFDRIREMCRMVEVRAKTQRPTA